MVSHRPYPVVTFLSLKWNNKQRSRESVIASTSDLYCVVCQANNELASCPAEEAGRGSLLHRQSCPPDDPTGHLTELQWTKQENIGQVWRSNAQTLLMCLQSLRRHSRWPQTEMMLYSHCFPRWNEELWNAWRCRIKLVGRLSICASWRMLKSYCFSSHTLKELTLKKQNKTCFIQSRLSRFKSTVITEAFRWKGRQSINYSQNLAKPVELQQISVFL